MKNKVELIGHYGSDEVIACSAWTSTNRNLSDEKKGRIGKLINDLWKNGHETPFEKGVVHFLVTTDIASHIHLLKHRISSLNAESARYKELKEDNYYIPEDWLEDKELIFWAKQLTEFTEYGNRLYHNCLGHLTPVLGRKRAKESARFFKTYNSQIEADVMFNMRSFANLQRLRNSEHAQLEIREIAKDMLNLVKNIEGRPFKHTLKAWGYGEN
jgi:thymidylate synthase (FAD)